MSRAALCTHGLLTAESRVSDIQYALEALECERVVLDHAVPEPLANVWRPHLLNAEPQVAAVVAPYPAPQSTRQTVRFSPRDTRLAAPDRLERDEALALLRPTLAEAEAVQAPIVAFSGGPLPLGGLTRSLHALIASGDMGTPKGRTVATHARREREALAGQVVDGWSFALESLLPEAEERGLTLGLMEAAGFDWAGTESEIEALLNRFTGADVVWVARPLDQDVYEQVDYPHGTAQEGRVPPAALLWSLPGSVDEQEAARIEDLISLGLGREEHDSACSMFATSDGSVFSEWHRTVWRSAVETLSQQSSA